MPRSFAMPRSEMPCLTASTIDHSVGVSTSACGGRPRRREATPHGNESDGEFPYPTSESALEERHARQFRESGEERVLKLRVRGFSGRGERSAMVPVPAAHDGSGIVAD